MYEVMVVDDEVVITTQLEERLSYMGFKVTRSASSGQEAINRARRFKPDIILMDIVMPGDLDGIDAAEIIKTELDIPVVFLTAYADDIFINRAKGTEPYGYVLKPFQAREIKATIEIALHKKNSERQLRELKERYRSMVETANDAIITTDGRGNIVFWNSAAEQMFGYSADKSIGKPLAIIVPKRLRKTLETKMNSILLTRKSGVVGETVELSGRRKDGSEFPLELSMTTWKIKERVFFTTMVHRTTDGKEEKETLQAQLLERQKMEAVGTLTAGIAHNFNNMLTALQGYSDLAVMDINDTDTLRVDLKQISSIISQVANITKQLLIFGRKQPIQLTTINLNQAVQHLVTILTPLISKKVTVKTNLEPDLWAIQADQEQMRQVLINLVLNARDAMPQGGNIIITTENVHLDAEYCRNHIDAYPGRYVCLSIEDTGVGMEKETIKHIFEPFFTTKGMANATGLGLAVVHSIVEQQQSWITVESEINQGSVFKIYLLVILETKERMSLENPGQGTGKRILLVEDGKELRQFLARALGENGYVVFEAEDVQEALKIFEREKENLDLIFSDVVLPGRSGLQLIEELLFQKPNLSVLLSSGYPDLKPQQSLIEKKRFAFLPKPYSLADLLGVVKKTLKPR